MCLHEIRCGVSSRTCKSARMDTTMQTNVPVCHNVTSAEECHSTLMTFRKHHRVLGSKFMFRFSGVRACRLQCLSHVQGGRTVVLRNAWEPRGPVPGRKVRILVCHRPAALHRNLGRYRRARQGRIPRPPLPPAAVAATPPLPSPCVCIRSMCHLPSPNVSIRNRLKLLNVADLVSPLPALEQLHALFIVR